jgi:hypothetical protein
MRQFGQGFIANEGRVWPFTLKGNWIFIFRNLETGMHFMTNLRMQSQRDWCFSLCFARHDSIPPLCTAKLYRPTWGWDFMSPVYHLLLSQQDRPSQHQALYIFTDYVNTGVWCRLPWHGPTKALWFPYIHHLHWAVIIGTRTTSLATQNQP